MVTIAKGGQVPPELEALEEGEQILTINEVETDLENTYQGKPRPAVKVTYETVDGATFLSSMGLSLFEGKGDRAPAKFRQALEKLNIPITEVEGADGEVSYEANEQLMVGRKVKAFVEKSPSGWPKVTKILRAADNGATAAEAAVADGLPA